MKFKYLGFYRSVGFTSIIIAVMAFFFTDSNNEWDFWAVIALFIFAGFCLWLDQREKKKLKDKDILNDPNRENQERENHEEEAKG